jgi:hypothetical protein
MRLWAIPMGRPFLPISPLDLLSSHVLKEGGNPGIGGHVVEILNPNDVEEDKHSHEGRHLSLFCPRVVRCSHLEAAGRTS